MPTEQAHIRLAQRNEDALNHLRSDVARYAEWVATVAFYKALHIIEAVFARNESIRHGRDHRTRRGFLKRDNRYQKIYRHYQHLYFASQVARYLAGDRTGKEYTVFSDYLSPDKVETQLVRGDLKELEKSAAKFLSRGSAHALGLAPAPSPGRGRRHG